MNPGVYLSVQQFKDPTDMRAILFYLFLLPGMLSFGQELLDQQHWPNGNLKATRFSDGVRIHFITYHENGQVKELGCFAQGKRDGIWKQYSDTGALLAQAGFRNGERQGVWEFRNADDRPLGRLTYSNGMLTSGEQFNDAGELLAQRSY